MNNKLLETTVRPERADLTDAELLDRYVDSGDESAFESLVRRHGPMVLGACRRVLRNNHDAEDAFQATFLVLAQKARSIVPRGMVANWLYGVAHKTASKANGMIGKRRIKEEPLSETAEARATKGTPYDLSEILEAEICRLPTKYRCVIVMCGLEGKTYREAARQLSLSESAVSVRLVRARTLLAKKLTRHGVAVSIASLGAALSENLALASVPPSLIAHTVNAASLWATGQAVATGVISNNVAALTQGVLHTMFVTKLKIATLATVFFVATSGATGWLLFHAVGAEPSRIEQETQPRLPTQAKKEPASGERLNGTWVVASEEIDGKESADSPQLKDKCQWVIKDGRLTIKFNGQSTESILKIDPNQQPTTIDLKDQGGRTSEGIYEVDGDELKVCLARVGENGPFPRPQDFDTKPGKSALLTLKRAK